MRSPAGLLDLMRLTGHGYPALEKHLADAPEVVQRDLIRLARDVEGEVRSREQRARREPWRR